MAMGQSLPAISAWSAASLSVLFTVCYVLPFYLSPATRPSPTINRDAPSVVRARIRTVSLACLISTISTIYIITQSASNPANSYTTALHLLGYYPLTPVGTSFLYPLILTALLFLGPLFEKLITNSSPSNVSSLCRLPIHLYAYLSTPTGFRNFIAGPVTEEILFRSVLIPLHLLSHHRPSQIVFLTPLYFGIAHIHHYYEFRLAHPQTPALPALLRSLFQFGYTTLFGWYASFVFLRTGSLAVVVLVHSFCNWCGLPRFWGRLVREGGEENFVREIAPPVPLVRLRSADREGHVHDVQATAARPIELSVGWTVGYYVLLMAGAYGFKRNFWTLTESSNALVEFSQR